MTNRITTEAIARLRMMYEQASQPCSGSDRRELRGAEVYLWDALVEHLDSLLDSLEALEAASVPGPAPAEERLREEDDMQRKDERKV